MGVDYSPVGGVGIEITDDIRKKLVVANEGDYDGCMHTLLDELEISYSESGSENYGGEPNRFFMLVDGTTLTQINNNAASFIIKLQAYGIKVTVDDLQIIQELHIW